MFSKETAHALIDRIPDNEYAEKAIKQICAIAKKAGKETRCAPKRRNRDSSPSDMLLDCEDISETEEDCSGNRIKEHPAWRSHGVDRVCGRQSEEDQP